MHWKSDNIEVMTCDNVDKVLGERFQSLLSRYQIGLEISITGSNFVFESIQQLCYKYHKVNFKLCGSYLSLLTG